MNALANSFEVRQLQGFAVYVLHNDWIEVAVVPELGAKILSLKNRRSGRDWLWHPGDELQLFKNGRTDAFSQSTLAGVDECLPTIQACTWEGRQVPDHGEVWNCAWAVDEATWQSGILTTSIRLPTSPFHFQRTMKLADNEVRLEYKLSNLAATQEHYLWALHPLLRLAPGDVLDLPASTRSLLNGATWTDAVVSAIPKNNCAKVFACPVAERWAAIENEVNGDRLEFAWTGEENCSLGLWLTRGGWHGHHHFAIEPTNANDDSLAVAAAQRQCGTIPAHGSASWKLRIGVGASINYTLPS